MPDRTAPPQRPVHVWVRRRVLWLASLGGDVAAGRSGLFILTVWRWSPGCCVVAGCLTAMAEK